jgi:hypothetical protein
MQFIWRRVLALFTVFSVGWTVSATAETLLPIEPVYQQTPVWCWAAVGEMVFEYHGVHNINPAGNFQCGIIALVHPICNQNCGNCPIPAGSLRTMNNMLVQYPRVASSASSVQTRISTSVSHNALSLENLKREIDLGRPVVAGISPSGYRHVGVSEHVALIVGYDGADIIVNDPFPFSSSAFSGDPYIAADGARLGPGQYRIGYSRFRRNLQWKESIYRIECSGADCESNSADHAGTDDTSGSDDEEQFEERDLGRSCATPATRCGPFFNQPALPIGSACYCATPYGPAGGRVVRP